MNNPSPQQVRQAREAAGLTQDQAAALVYSTGRNWRMWEAEGVASARKMHPAIFELFRLKAGLA